MILIITRHGETIDNKNKIAQGHMPGVLSELGIQQAKKVAERLKKENLDCIFSSDLNRALDTAKEIAKFHPETLFKQTKDLRERFLGDFEGKIPPEDYRKNRWELNIAEKYNLETSEQMFKRVEKIIKKLLQNHHGKNILLVTHGGLSQVLITYLLGKSQENLKELNLFGNTAITIFEFDEDKNPILKLMGCTKHLDE